MDRRLKIFAVYESRADWVARNKTLANRCGYERFLESEDSINRIIQATKKAGFAVVKWKIGPDLFSTLRQEMQTDSQSLLWNLTDGSIYYAGSMFPEFARMHSLPFLGSSSSIQMVCQRKPLLKAVAKGMGISTANGLVFGKAAPASILIPENFEPPFFVKPSLLDNGIGDNIAPPICKSAQAAIDSANTLFASGIDEVLVESYLPGREYTVIAAKTNDNWILECAEILHNGPGYFSSALKDADDYKCDFQSTNFCAELKIQTMRLADAIGLQDYFRADYRCDAAGKAYLLEVNSSPFLISGFFERFSRRHFSSLSKMIHSIIQQSYLRQCPDNLRLEQTQKEFFLPY